MSALATADDLRAYRDQVRLELAENRRHVLLVLRNPGSGLAAVPVGDLLCWCDGLDEAAVARVLAASEVAWGRRLSLLSARDVAMVCFQIKVRHPEIWQRWRESLRRAAA